MMYIPVRLLICPVWYLTNTSSLLISRSLRWKSGRGSTSPRRKGIKRSWYLGPSTPSWGLMNKTTATCQNCYSYALWKWILTSYCSCLLREPSTRRTWTQISRHYIPFRLGEGEPLPYFHLRALAIRSELVLVRYQTGKINNITGKYIMELSNMKNIQHYITSIEGVNIIESWLLCGWRSNHLKYSSKEVM